MANDSKMIVLEVRDLKKSYQSRGESLEILKGVNLQVTAGETIALLGQSGSGKSTLLSLLAGLDTPDSGIVKVNGTEIQKMPETDLIAFRAKNIGIVFQNFYLIDTLTSLENVALPLEIKKDNEALQKASALLRQVGLENRLHHTPDQLSGGEKQRVAIARALALNPHLLLADEPTGSLDTTTGNQVLKLLFDISQRYKTALLVVTHNPEIAAQCNRILTLKNGALVS